MQAFKVGHFRLVSGIGQRFEAGFNEAGQPAAQNSLLTEQIGFGFFLKARFQNTSPS